MQASACQCGFIVDMKVSKYYNTCGFGSMAACFEFRQVERSSGKEPLSGIGPTRNRSGSSAASAFCISP